jgi:hypothetical protein
VTRKALADVLRADGYGVSNARASALLKELKPELDGRIFPSGLPGVSSSAQPKREVLTMHGRLNFTQLPRCERALGRSTVS